MEKLQSHNSRFPEQDKNGTDLSLIRESLRLSPLERTRRHEKARLSMLWMKQNARRITPKPD